MKKTTMSSAVLVTAIALGMVTPMTASADQATLTGKGEVTYKEDTSIVAPQDPENPAEELDPADPSVTVNPNGGVITIDAVTNLNFGEQIIGVSPAAQTYYAAPAELTLSYGTTQTRGHFVQWTDKRAGNDHTYTIKAAMTAPFTNGSNKLEGATVSYANGMLNSEMDVAKNWPTATPQNFALTADNGSQLVFDNSAATGAQGMGTYTAEFGQSAADVTNARGDKSTGLAGDSVSLEVPGGQNLVAGKYVADITWTIEYAPAPVTPTP